jgi:hypothetical protein
VRWAEKIGDKSRREMELTDIFLDWLKKDPIAAREWLQASSLPRQFKEHFLAPERDSGELSEPAATP